MSQTNSENHQKSTPSIEAVLFDFGKVLSGPPNPAVWAQMHAIVGLEEKTFYREYWAHRRPYDRGTHTGEAYWQHVSEGTGTNFSKEQITQLLAADASLWSDPNPSMIAWAAQLQQAGIRTGILSNIGDAMEIGVLANCSWLRGFDHCIWSHSLKLAKPEAEIYRLAAEGLKTSPEKILFIDDRPENIEGARAVGMQAIQYDDHAQFIAEMESRGLGALLSPEGIATARR